MPDAKEADRALPGLETVVERRELRRKKAEAARARQLINAVIQAEYAIVKMFEQPDPAVLDRVAHSLRRAVANWESRDRANH